MYYIVVGTLGLAAVATARKRHALRYSICFFILFAGQIVFVGFYFAWRSQMQSWLNQLEASVDESSGDVFGQAVYTVYNNRAYFITASVIICTVEAMVVLVICLCPRRYYVQPTPLLAPTNAEAALNAAVNAPSGEPVFTPWRPPEPLPPPARNASNAGVRQPLLPQTGPSSGGGGGGVTYDSAADADPATNEALRQSLMYRSPPLLLATQPAQPSVSPRDSKQSSDDRKSVLPSSTASGSGGASNITATTDGEELCGNCRSRAPDAVNLPCGHNSYCWSCAHEFVKINGAVCDTCDQTSSLVQLKSDKVCDVCLETHTGADVFGLGACGHLMCVGCGVQLVRDALGDHNKFPIRCPTYITAPAATTGSGSGSGGGGSKRSVRCGGILKEEQIRQLAAQARRVLGAGGSGASDNKQNSVKLLTTDAIKQFMRLNLQAAIPAKDRVYCPNASCGGISIRPSASISDAMGPLGLCVRCGYCRNDFCLRCLVSWHPGKTCATVKKEQAGLDLATHRLIAATTRPCPGCSVSMTHYFGHYCHHITPGDGSLRGPGSGGCRNCGTHFCFNCLKMRTNPLAKNCQCPTYCEVDVRTGQPLCACVACPDCKPGAPCPHCPNDGRCPSCRL